MAILYFIQVHNPDYKDYDTFPEDVWTSEWYENVTSRTLKIKGKGREIQECASYLIAFDDLTDMNIWLQENKMPEELKASFDTWRSLHNITLVEKYVTLPDFDSENPIF
jgi:hypothetical protein